MDPTSVSVCFVSPASGNGITAFICDCDCALSGAFIDDCDWLSDLWYLKSLARVSLWETIPLILTDWGRGSLTEEPLDLLWGERLLSVTCGPNLCLWVEVWVWTHKAGVSVFTAAAVVQELGEESLFIEAMCSCEISASFSSSVSFSWPCSTYEKLSGPCSTVKQRPCWERLNVATFDSWTASMLRLVVWPGWALLPLLRTGSWSVGEHVPSVSGELPSTIVFSWSEELEW